MLLSATVVLTAGCQRGKQKADIPDIQSLFNSISFLDTLVRSDQVDSIGTINGQITATLTTYAGHARSAEDVAILDSLTRINTAVIDFIQLCTSTQDNLGILQQEVKNLENQYRSGKIDIAAYISATLEVEQIIIDIRNQLTEKNMRALLYLRNRQQLIDRLSPLSTD
jgi:hypothetical protein